MDDNKLKQLQELLKLIENGEEILEPNLEAIAKLAEENERPPKEFEELFKKKFKDILA
jgi:hypothetical protein